MKPYWKSTNKKVVVMSETLAIAKDERSAYFVSLNKLSEALEDIADEQEVKMPVYSVVNDERVVLAEIVVVNHRIIKEVKW